MSVDGKKKSKQASTKIAIELQELRAVEGSVLTSTRQSMFFKLSKMQMRSKVVRLLFRLRHSFTCQLLK